MNKFKFIDVQSVLDQNDSSDKMKSQMKHYIMEIKSGDLPENMRPVEGNDELLKGVFLPSGLTATHVFNSSLSRNDGKFPTLQFIHKKSGNSIWRSSEINRAMMNKEQLFDDIQFLKQLAAMTGRLIIYNHRDSTTQSSERNYGYESKKFYQDIDKIYYQFPSKSKLVRAFEQMWQLTNNIPEKGFVKTANNIKWPQMIEDILLKAFFLVKNLRTHTVLIQCQNGKDASSVLSSLAQIISDPYYRTF